MCHGKGSERRGGEQQAAFRRAWNQNGAADRDVDDREHRRHEAVHFAEGEAHHPEHPADAEQAQGIQNVDGVEAQCARLPGNQPQRAAQQSPDEVPGPRDQRVRGRRLWQKLTQRGGDDEKTARDREDHQPEQSHPLLNEAQRLLGPLRHAAQARQGAKAGGEGVGRHGRSMGPSPSNEQAFAHAVADWRAGEDRAAGGAPARPLQVPT